LKSRASLKSWGIVIADHVSCGLADRFTPFTLWKPDAVRITAGAEHIGMFRKTPASERQYCQKCGGHLMTHHPEFGLMDVFATTLPTLKFSPGVDVNYAETVLPIRDGLPKFRDLPIEFGASGEQLAE
jgi:hypothetical protein